MDQGVRAATATTTARGAATSASCTCQPWAGRCVRSKSARPSPTATPRHWPAQVDGQQLYFEDKRLESRRQTRSPRPFSPSSLKKHIGLGGGCAAAAGQPGRGTSENTGFGHGPAEPWCEGARARGWTRPARSSVALLFHAALARGAFLQRQIFRLTILTRR